VLHVGVGWSAIEVEIVLLDVLTMVTFGVGQAEKTLLDDRVLFIPEGQGKAESLPVIAKAGKTVFPPLIGARAGLVMAEIAPCVPAVAIVLADCRPLTFAKIRSPHFPRSISGTSFAEPEGFGIFCHLVVTTIINISRPAMLRLVDS